MVENLLLDARAIYHLLEPFGAQTSAQSVGAVQAALDAAVQSREEEEVRLRVQRKLPIGRLSLRPDELGAAEAVARAETDKWLSKIAALDVPDLQEAAHAEVAAIITSGQQLARFHGKAILHDVYSALRVADAGLGKSAFALSLAASPFAAERAQGLAGSAVDQVRLFFPEQLPRMLGQEGDPTASAELAARCQTHYAAWTGGHPLQNSREEVSAHIFAFARTLSEGPRKTLVELASQIGTA